MQAIMPYVELGVLAAGVAILIAQAIGNHRIGRLEKESGTIRRALIMICDGNRRAAMRILAGPEHPDADAA